MSEIGVIFDMDGLLFDTEKVYQEIWHTIAHERGIVLADTFIKDITGTNGNRMCRLIEKYYGVADGNEIINECMQRVFDALAVYVPKKPGVDEFLKYLKEKNIKIAVASSSSKEQIIRNLKNTETYSYFDAIVSGAEVLNGKPAPDIFILAAKRIGCTPENCYVFEDSENGIRAGKAAGCKAIMIPDMLEPSEEMKEISSGIYTDFFEVMKHWKDQ